jgi:inorganic pyrophosphatase
MFKMEDERGIDDKIICVPPTDPNWASVGSLEQIPELLRAEIEQFFSIYKELERGKRVVLGGWRSREEAHAEIASARRRARRSD